jgi:hypothetical protein
MTHIGYSELTKRYYFLPEKGKKIDITDDINEILKSQFPDSKGNASAEEQEEILDDIWNVGKFRNYKDWYNIVTEKYTITKKQ